MKIYQINTERDENRIKFMSLDRIEHFQGSVDVDPSIYDEVFNAEINEADPEDIYRRFNTEGHPLHRGHSLSVSDVVVIDGEAPNLVGRIRFYNSSSAFGECDYTDEAKFRKAIFDAREVGRTIQIDELQGRNIPSVECDAYYCDSVGFQKIEFDESKAHKPDNLMRIVYVEPHREPYMAEVADDIDSLQRAVRGLIEPVYNGDGTIIVCNDEAKLIGMEGNRRIQGDIIAEPFFVVGDDGERFRSLTESEASAYMDRFAQPEEIDQDEVEANTGMTFFSL